MANKKLKGELKNSPLNSSNTIKKSSTRNTSSSKKIQQFNKKLDKLDVTGKTIEDFMHIDFTTINLLDAEDLRAIGNRLVSAANKRIKRATTSMGDFLPPSIQNLVNKGTKKFSTRDKDRNQLLKLYKDVTGFLKKETSSLKGFTKLRKKTYQRLGIQWGHWSKEEEKEFWELYRQHEEELGGESAVKMFGSDSVQRLFRQEFDNARERKVALENKIKEVSRKIYEEQLEEDEEIEDAFTN